MQALGVDRAFRMKEISRTDDLAAKRFNSRHSRFALLVEVCPGNEMVNETSFERARLEKVVRRFLSDDRSLIQRACKMSGSAVEPAKKMELPARGWALLGSIRSAGPCSIGQIASFKPSSRDRRYCHYST
jgi:hypothetical protein